MELIDIKDVDGSQYLVDPRLTDKEILEKFKKIPEFSITIPKVDMAKAIRFIILLYDINNDDVQSYYPDFWTRKRECARLAGFKINADGFSTEVEDCITCQNDDFNQMIIRYVRMFDNPDYITYVSFWNMLFNEHRNSMSERSPSAIKTISANIEFLSDKVNQLSKAIFRGDDVMKLRNELYKTMEKEMLNLRPEEIAISIDRKKLNIPDPYYGKA